MKLPYEQALDEFKQLTGYPYEDKTLDEKLSLPWLDSDMFTQLRQKYKQTLKQCTDLSDEEKNEIFSKNSEMFYRYDERVLNLPSCRRTIQAKRKEHKELSAKEFEEYLMKQGHDAWVKNQFRKPNND